MLSVQPSTRHQLYGQLAAWELFVGLESGLMCRTVVNTGQHGAVHAPPVQIPGDPSGESDFQREGKRKQQREERELETREG